MYSVCMRESQNSDPTADIQYSTHIFLLAHTYIHTDKVDIMRCKECITEFLNSTHPAAKPPILARLP